MPVTPQITLSITILDYSGAALGSSTQPAFVRIALCGFGNSLPSIVGTGFVGKVATWPADIPYLGTTLTVKLWGNDVISPGGTYYMISLLDASRNVVQAACYQLTGNGTQDLTTLSPYLPPGSPTPITPTIQAGMVNVAFTTSMTFNCALVSAGVILFKAGTLTGNVASSVIQNAQQGQIITIEVTQDATGNRTFAWPAACVGPGLVDPSAGYVSIQSFQYDGTYFRALTALLSYPG